MTSHRQTLTSRDVLTQAFEPKAKRGYEPREVDSYLRIVADTLDLLHDEVETLKLQLATMVPGASAAIAPMAAAPTRAEHESLEMILRLAQKTAEDTLAEAHRRADEVVAEASFRSAQISREADRKAFEAASRTQSELRTVEADIDARRDELTAVHAALQTEQARIRDVAAQLLSLSVELTWDDDLVDLTDEPAPREPLVDAPAVARPAPVFVEPLAATPARPLEPESSYPTIDGYAAPGGHTPFSE